MAQPRLDPEGRALSAARLGSLVSRQPRDAGAVQLAGSVALLSHLGRRASSFVPGRPAGLRCGGEGFGGSPGAGLSVIGFVGSKDDAVKERLEGVAVAHGPGGGGVVVGRGDAGPGEVPAGLVGEELEEDALGARPLPSRKGWRALRSERNWPAAVTKPSRSRPRRCWRRARSSKSWRPGVRSIRRERRGSRLRSC